MIDINFLGEFEDIKAVWKKYPEGGKEGDYLTIKGERVRWDKYDRIWRGSPVVNVTNARDVRTIYGDVEVHNNVTIGGVLRVGHIKQPYLGLFSSLDALKKEWPDPEVGMWAYVGDSIPASIYRCDTEGEWTATGGTGGVGIPDLSEYQKKLVSGQNIKTINGETLLGEGDIEIVAGGGTPEDEVMFIVSGPNMTLCNVGDTAIMTIKTYKGGHLMDVHWGNNGNELYLPVPQNQELKECVEIKLTNSSTYKMAVFTFKLLKPCNASERIGHIIKFNGTSFRNVVSLNTVKVPTLEFDGDLQQELDKRCRILYFDGFEDDADVQALTGLTFDEVRYIKAKKQFAFKRGGGYIGNAKLPGFFDGQSAYANHNNIFATKCGEHESLWRWHENGELIMISADGESGGGGSSYDDTALKKAVEKRCRLLKFHGMSTVELNIEMASTKKYDRVMFDKATKTFGFRCPDDNNWYFSALGADDEELGTLYNGAFARGNLFICEQHGNYEGVWYYGQSNDLVPLPQWKNPEELPIIVNPLQPVSENGNESTWKATYSVNDVLQSIAIGKLCAWQFELGQLVLITGFANGKLFGDYDNLVIEQQDKEVIMKPRQTGGSQGKTFIEASKLPPVLDPNIVYLVVGDE